MYENMAGKQELSLLMKKLVSVIMNHFIECTIMVMKRKIKIGVTSAIDKSYDSETKTSNGNVKLKV